MIGALARADIERFRSVVAQRLGLHFDDGKLGFLADILAQRMERTGHDRFSLYLQLISSSISGTEEMRAVAERLTVCETYFFRYADHFRAFTEVVVPGLIQSPNRRRQLRILSAGCASGEEAYSLAILVRDRLPDLASWEITIRGVDVNTSMLERALRGRYTTWSLRETPADLRTKYFCADGRDLRLDDTVRSMVTFEERNVVEEDSLFWQRGAFDVVFCRNVTMYFTPEATRSVIARISRSLAPGGYLFMGHAETLRGISQDFHLRHTHETFYYQHRGAHEASSTDIFGQAAAGNGSSPTPVPAMVESSDSWFDIIQRASERIVNLTEERIRPVAGRSGAIALQEVASPAPTWDRTLAIELLRKERFTEAMQLLRALPPESKTDADAQLLLAVLLTNGGNLPEAEEVCRRLLKLDELNAGAHYLMALCREHVGDQEAALEHDRAAVYLDSAFAMPHLHIGLVAKRSADVETAKREFGQALTLLDREDASKILLFGGGFTRETLTEFCREELRAYAGDS